MPTYDYKCTVCGHVFEVRAKMDAPPPCCPRLVLDDVVPGVLPAPVGTCGGATGKTFALAAPVHFHGGGWAKDGYSK